jgi:hypothetical protein
MDVHKFQNLSFKSSYETDNKNYTFYLGYSDVQ